ncbi:MAG: FoF1 ATP synthase subunit a, partial [Lawsonibacter sp.]|nr:FoF1 ATP synthase subunit a [Lawsonibacter sp.]
MKETMAESMSGTPSISVFGLFTVPQSVVVTWIIMLALALVFFLAGRNLKKKPSRIQVIVEMAVGGLNNFFKQNLGEHWRSFAPWLGTVAIYLVCANLAGIAGLDPPTRDLSVTASLALMSMLLIYGSQFRFRGFVGGLKKFAEPTAVLMPINLMEIAIRPLSLCMRLFGNILASYVIMEMIKALLPAVLPVFC